MMVKSLEKVNKVKPMTPGYGMAGIVMCPVMSLTHPAQCIKQGCEWWVELNSSGQMVARCSIAWLAVLSTEIRQAVANLKEEVKK